LANWLRLMVGAQLLGRVDEDRVAVSWVQIQLQVPGSVTETLDELCLEMGALAVTLADAARDAQDSHQGLLEPPPGATIVWENVVMSSLWPVSADFQQVRQRLDGFLIENRILAEFKVDFVEETEWAARWSEPQGPLRFGADALWLVPRSWTSGETEELGIAPAVIRLDAGLAFGSGQHPTTALCLEWLAQARWDGARVLDYGCGSGVLGLAALALGAEAVVGVDYDPQALIASHENACFNSCDSRMSLSSPTEFVVEARYDLVVANILANPLIELAPMLSQCLRPQGSLILAGLLAEQVDKVRHAYPDIRFGAPARQGEWIRLEGSRAAA